MAERSEVPCGQQQVRQEPGHPGVVKELGEVISTAGTEADDQTAAFTQVATHPAENLHPGIWCEERHDVARAHHHVEALDDPR